MAATEAFMAVCRPLATALPEFAAFRSAITSLANSSRDTRLAAWHSAFHDNQAGGSPALRLRTAVRGVVRAQADADGTVSPADREDAYRRLAAELCPGVPRPPTKQEEQDEFLRLVREQLIS